MTTEKADALLDELIANYGPENILGENGLAKMLTKRLIERCLDTEMSQHLGYEKHAVEGNNSGNSRNGYSKKKIKGKSGIYEIKIPRDRNGSFQPKLVEKHQRRFDELDEKVLSMYGLGMTTRDIQKHIEEIYGYTMSHANIAEITDSIKEDVEEWRTQQLDAVYPIVYFDAMFFKVRDDHRIKQKAVYLGLGIDKDGNKQLLGMWIQQTEGARFWANIMAELSNRGVQDILIACVDGLKGFPEAIKAVFPQADVQLCIVHKVRSSFKYVTTADRPSLTADLKAIYTAPTAEAGEKKLQDFEDKWADSYAIIVKQWRDQWENLKTFYDYPAGLRKVIYTTNPMEAVNRSFRKVTKNRGAFPNDMALYKLFYLAQKHVTKKWTQPVSYWKGALNFFHLKHGDRLLLTN